jgi:hypothetical protein
VHLGAILTVPAGVPSPERDGRTENASPGIAPIAQWQVLGKSVLNRTIERLQAFGVAELSVLTEHDVSPNLPHASASFWTSWEQAIARFVQFELGILLLVRVGPYVEIDIAEWVRFHRETASPMTQVYDERGALDLVAIDVKRLTQGTGSYRRLLRDLIPGHHRYRANGYVNRLSNVAEFRRLVRDALNGVASIRPIGREVSANVWVGENAQIDHSVRILAPAYIGSDSRVAGACSIRGASAIEQCCHIDFGTTVNDSCVLANSYVGSGLRLSHSIVSRNTLFNLRRDLQLQFRDRRLFGESNRPLLSRKRSALAQSVTS